MDVFLFSGSGYAWRVLLALEIKGLGYNEVMVQASQAGLKSQEFLAMNPRGKVPVVRDGSYVLPESLAIMAYLERRQQEPPLFGRSAEETGLIWRAVLDFDLYVCQAWVTRIIVPIFLGQAAERADDIRQAERDSHADLGRLEAAVGKSGWIAGPELSAADIAVFPFLEWRRRIKDMPAYARTYPAYWRQIDEAVAA